MLLNPSDLSAESPGQKVPFSEANGCTFLRYVLALHSFVGDCKAGIADDSV